MALGEVIDVHTHTFRTAEAGINWQKAIGHANPERSGAIEELLPLMEQANISKAIMLMYVPSQYIYAARSKALPTQEPQRSRAEAELKAHVIDRVIANNQWGCDVTQQHPNLVPFCHLDPVFMSPEQMVNEIDDKVKKGCKGLKIVPLMLQMYGNDERLWPIYKEADSRHLPLLTQSGGGPGRESGPYGAWGRPKFFEEAAKTFPNMSIILAHIGRGASSEVAELTHRYPNVFTDLSSRLDPLDKPGEWTRKEAVSWIRRIGVDRVMFGTNYPGSDPVEYVQIMDSLELTDSEKDAICAGNAKRVIGL